MVVKNIPSLSIATDLRDIMHSEQQNAGSVKSDAMKRSKPTPEGQ
jgi:hypothetical protein